MEAYYEYREEGLVRFELAIKEYTIEQYGVTEKSGVYVLISNIPSELIQELVPDLEARLDLNHELTPEERQLFLKEIGDRIYNDPRATFFFYPINSTTRTYNEEYFFERYHHYQIEKEIKSNILYSTNIDADEFYQIRREFSYYRIFSGKYFADSVDKVTQQDFEKHLLPEFGDEYFQFYSNTNLFFLSKEEKTIECFLTDEHFALLLFFRVPYK